jgi:enterochelin esterase family protein
MRRALTHLAVAGATLASLDRVLAQAPTPTPPAALVSPEIGANRDVTMRVRAPKASEVVLVSGGDIPGVGRGGLALQRGSDGVWQTTIKALDSGGYRYRFTVDGVQTPDPSNPLTSQSNTNSWSLFYVPGATFMDAQRVPHGAVAEVHYFSTALGRDRRMHVYTPPGYERGGDRYPVLYLLHGAFDGDNSWSTVGRAGFILDNLIAAGQAVPMIVVMPDGHTTRFQPGGPPADSDEFVRDFVSDIRPLVEKGYRVRTGRATTAIAGLSMGGAQTLDIAMGNLGGYAYIGVFSSGVFGARDGAAWEQRHRAALGDAALKKGLKKVWFATGREDGVMAATKSTVGLLQKHGFDVVFQETTGGHTWINWREYLNVFTPMLFR